MLYWSTIFVISSVFFDIDFVQVRVFRFSGILQAMFFVSLSGGLFRFTFVHTAKL